MPSTQSCLFEAPWTAVCQAPLPMEFSRPEYWNGVPAPTPGIFLTQGSSPCLLHLLHWEVDSLTTIWEALIRLLSL